MFPCHGSSLTRPYPTASFSFCVHVFPTPINLCTLNPLHLYRCIHSVRSAHTTPLSTHPHHTHVAPMQSTEYSKAKHVSKCCLARPVRNLPVNLEQCLQHPVRNTSNVFPSLGVYEAKQLKLVGKTLPISGASLPMFGCKQPNLSVALLPKGYGELLGLIRSCATKPASPIPWRSHGFSQERIFTTKSQSHPLSCPTHMSP